MRKGLGLGKGKGYYNLMPIDSHIHSLNARGIKLQQPVLTILTPKQFDKKFKDDYESYEVGYATTRIHPDGETKIYLKDSGDFQRNMKLIAHEFNELAIWEHLINEEGVDPKIADEMAHNLNEVKVEGVMDTYELDASN